MPTKRPLRARGFTLIEALVALVVVSLGAGASLAYMRTLLDYHHRLNAQQEAVSRLLNRTAELQITDLAPARIEARDNALLLYAPPSPDPILRIVNFSTEGAPVPVELAFTPYQVYIVGERRQVRLLLPGLLPPRNAPLAVQ